jgi:hypothetical protein
MPDRSTLGAGVRRYLPWLVALAVLGFLVREVKPEALRDAFRHGAYAALSVYIVFELAVALPIDAFASRVALAEAGVRRPWSEVLLARGSTYLLGLLSYMVGQGGMGFYLARTGVPLARSAGAVLLLLVANAIVLAVLGAAGLLVELSRGELDGVPHGLLLLMIGGLLAGIVVYLAVIALRPR